jgi:hypothetical protein
MAQMSLIQSWHRSEFNHLLQSVPISFVLCTWLVHWGIVHLRDQLVSIRVFAVLVLLMLGFTGAIILYMNIPTLKSPSAVIESLRVYAQQREDLLQYIKVTDPNHPYVDAMLFIREHTTEEDRILSLPLLTSFYYLVERQFGGGQMLIVPGYFNSTEEQQQMIDRMETENVTIVLYQLDFMLDNREERQMSVFAPLLNDYIEGNYQEIRKYGQISIRLRQDKQLK